MQHLIIFCEDVKKYFYAEILGFKPPLYCFCMVDHTMLLAKLVQGSNFFKQNSIQSKLDPKQGHKLR